MSVLVKDRFAPQFRDFPTQAFHEGRMIEQSSGVLGDHRQETQVFFGQDGAAPQEVLTDHSHAAE